MEIPKQRVNLFITVTVENKTMQIAVGDGSQSVRWLASAAISRWDEKEFQGWRVLGIPVTAKRLGKDASVNLDGAIRDVLAPGDHIVVTSSLQSSSPMPR